MPINRPLFALLAITLGLAFAGCKTSDPGVKNYGGSIRGAVAAQPDVVTKAAREALEELRLHSVYSQATMLDGKAMARTSHNKSVTIDITRADENASNVKIRVGDFGDEKLSLQILDRIRDKVK